MLGSLEGFVNSEEVYFPTRLLERMRKLPSHAQAYVADCVHLLHAWPQTDGLEQHSTVNCAAGAHRAGLYRSWDPEAFVVNLYRDPRDQVMSVVFRKHQYRAYEAPDASDDEYLQRKARHNATRHEAYRRGQPADFECSYEALCASPIETLGDLLERMGTPVAADRLTEVVARHDSGNIRAGTVAPVGNLPSTESPSWDQSVSEQYARVLHSELVQVVEDLGYSRDECLGRALDGAPLPTDTVCPFPPHRSTGRLYAATPGGEQRTWRPLGPARGRVELPAGHLIALRVAPEDPIHLDALASMHPPSLHALCLAGHPKANDALLRELVALGGLRELDLARTAVTDAGLDDLVELGSLGGLSLRDTAVSTDAAARFGRSHPECAVFLS